MSIESGFVPEEAANFEAPKTSDAAPEDDSPEKKVEGNENREAWQYLIQENTEKVASGDDLSEAFMEKIKESGFDIEDLEGVGVWVDEYGSFKPEEGVYLLNEDGGVDHLDIYGKGFEQLKKEANASTEGYVAIGGSTENKAVRIEDKLADLGITIVNSPRTEEHPRQIDPNKKELAEPMTREFIDRLRNGLDI